MHTPCVCKHVLVNLVQSWPVPGQPSCCISRGVTLFLKQVGLSRACLAVVLVSNDDVVGCVVGRGQGD